MLVNPILLGLGNISTYISVAQCVLRQLQKCDPPFHYLDCHCKRHVAMAKCPSGDAMLVQEVGSGWQAERRKNEE